MDIEHLLFLDEFDDDLRSYESFLLTIVKNGTIAREHAFALRGCTGISEVDEALKTIIMTPSISAPAFGYFRVEGKRELAVQLIDYTEGIEGHLYHEEEHSDEEDSDENVVRELPNLVLVATQLSQPSAEHVLNWSVLNDVRYLTISEHGPLQTTYQGRMDA